MTDSIILQPFNENWEERYKEIAAKLRAFLPDNAIIHHVGSTAINGLRAKDIIDVQVSVTDLGDIDCSEMAEHGFHFRPGVTDHCPEGISLDPRDLDKLYFKHFGPDAHIHVRVRGRLNQRFPLVSRDYLRSHPATAKAYERIKEIIVGRIPQDKGFYYAIKDPVFDIIYIAAEQWAEATYWVEPPPD